MSALDSWVRGEFTADGVSHDTYRQGAGPGVIVIHEIPAMSPECIAFGQEVVDAGFTVVMPHLFGAAGGPTTLRAIATVLPKLCVSKEFTTFATGRTSPIAVWLRALARDLRSQLARAGGSTGQGSTGQGSTGQGSTGQGSTGQGVGVVGMCFSGGFALAMMVDDAVVAPVVAQPSLPFAVSRKRGADLNLSPADLAVVKQRAAAGCPVLGLRYEKDRTTGTRFATLQRELGDAFRFVEFPGAKHATLTAHRQPGAVDAVLEFLSERLSTPS
jgi:dienelactone hydrolase